MTLLSAWAGDLVQLWRQSASVLDQRRAPRGAAGRALALAAGAALVFAASTPDAMPSGDAALYAQQAMAGDFGERTVHIGYFAFLAALTGFADAVPDRVFNLLSVLLAAATVWLVAWATASATDRRGLGLLAGVSLVGSYTFWRNAVWAEVYVSQAFFFVLACWLFWRRRPMASGLSLAASVLISPSTLLGVPGLCAARPRPRRVALLGLVGGAVVLMVLAFVWRDYFFSPRGLFGAAPSRAGLASVVVKEAFEVLYGVTALLPFLACGLWAAVRCRLAWPYLAAVGLIWAVTFLLGERYADVPVQLPTWILLAPLLAAGAGWLEDRLESLGATWRRVWLAGAAVLAVLPLLAVPVVARRARTFAALGTEVVAGLITAVVLAGVAAAWLAGRHPRLATRVAFVAWTACGAVLAASLVEVQNREHEDFKAQVLRLGELASPDFLAVASWERGVLAEHYLFGRSYAGHTVDVAALGRGEEEVRRAFDEAVAGGELWLLSESPGSAMPQVVDDLTAAGRPPVEVEKGLWRAAARAPGPPAQDDAGLESAVDPPSRQSPMQESPVQESPMLETSGSGGGEDNV